MTMQKFPVQFSSNVKEIGHDPSANLGYVRFHSGHEYLIQGLDAKTFEDWQKVRSKGSFYHRHIRTNRKLTITKIEHEKKDKKEEDNNELES